MPPPSRPPKRSNEIESLVGSHQELFAEPDTYDAAQTKQCAIQPKCVMPTYIRKTHFFVGNGALPRTY